MDTWLKKELHNRFPIIFRTKEPIWCENGWYDLIYTLCQELETIALSQKAPAQQTWFQKTCFNILSRIDPELTHVPDKLLDWCMPEKDSRLLIVQLKEKFACYDEQTEVLTKNGWKFFKDVKISDKIASLKDGYFLNYSFPTEIMSYKYSGEMYYLNTRGVNLLITPNHNLYVAKGSYYNGNYSPPKRVNYPFELSTYEKYLGKNKCFKKAAIWKGEYQEFFYLPKYENYWRNNFGITNKIYNEKRIAMNDWLNFLGWYIAEGCVSINDEKHSCEIAVACNNTDGGTEKKIINNAIVKCGFEPSLSMEDKSALLFKLYNKQLGLWLNDNCGNNSYNKRIPNFVKELPPEQIEILLESLFQGDGQQTDTANILTTTSKQLADDVQECLLKAGFTSRMYKPSPPGKMISPSTKKEYDTVECYKINWLKKSNLYNTANKGLAPGSFDGLVNYDGMVYCVSVPEHIIYVRRNGKPVWCGNSLRMYTINHTEEALKLIAEAEEKSFSICEKCGYPGKTYTIGYWLTTLCEQHYAERVTNSQGNQSEN